MKTHRPRNDDPKSRKCNYKFFVSKGALKVQVCKLAFISLHGVTEGRIRRLCNLLLEGQSPCDKRGKNPKHNVIPGNVCQKIHSHIESFPKKRTHYAGKQIEYLDARLDVKTMNSLFMQSNPNLPVKYEFYLKYFKENFRLRFGRPQVDTCIKCEELSIKIKSASLGEAAKRTSVAELMVHKRRAKKFYSKLQQISDVCKAEDDSVGICFDYMQNMPMPHIPVQDVFYLRQLWLYCFGVHNLKTERTKLYLYHEGKAKKGANEVCSILKKYIDSCVGDHVRKLYLFSDGCPGQNKNNTLVRFCLALVDTGRFDKVVHHFPIRGHSFLPNDRSFGTIKKKLRKYDRVYTPEQYQEIIKSASSKFDVEKIEAEDILNFATWWPSFYKKTCLSADSYGKAVPKEAKKTFATSEFMSFEYDSSCPGTVVTREFIDGPCSHTFKLSKPRTVPQVSLPATKAYPTSKVPIQKKKRNNIAQLQPYIEEEHKAFYNEILQWPTVEEEEEVEDEAF